VLVTRDTAMRETGQIVQDVRIGTDRFI